MDEATRERGQKLGLYLAKHRNQLEYPLHDVRGTADNKTWALITEAAIRKAIGAGRHLTFDCSQSTTQIFRALKLKDPNGFGYRTKGWTGSMLEHLEHFSKARYCHVLSLVVFGPATGDHVAWVLELDESSAHDHLLFSHGATHTAGPIRLSKERQYHRPPVTFLDVHRL